MYLGMVLDFFRRHPKVALIFALLIYSVTCIIHLEFFAGNKPFFSLSAVISLFIALPLTILYKSEEPKHRTELLSTERTWFDDCELD